MIILYNKVPYASVHDSGEYGVPKKRNVRKYTGQTKTIGGGSTTPSISLPKKDIKKTVVLKDPYVQGGVSGVVLGGKIHARPFMTPSGQVLEAYKKLTEAEMASFGWKQ